MKYTKQATSCLPASQADRIKTIDSVLPQTQCGLCGYNGCKPYATAIISENAPINLCTPGGVKTLKKLGEITQKNPTPHLEQMLRERKPPSLVTIREDECIGCTKCIQACPVDAIMGSAKKMHSVIRNECTGCDLCVPACPVDCIDIIPSTLTEFSKEQSDHFRLRHENKQARILKTKDKRTPTPITKKHECSKKDYVKLAIERAKLKKQHL